MLLMLCVLCPFQYWSIYPVQIILLVCTQAFQSYVRDLACPLAGQPRQEILDWIIGLAVRWAPLMYFSLPMYMCTCAAESIEWFIEDQAFLRSYDSAPRPPPSPLSRQQLVSLFSLPVCPGRAYRRSQIIRPQECLVLCKSFNTLWGAVSGSVSGIPDTTSPTLRVWSLKASPEVLKRKCGIFPQLCVLRGEVLFAATFKMSFTLLLAN